MRSRCLAQLSLAAQPFWFAADTTVVVPRSLEGWEITADASSWKAENVSQEAD